MAKQAGLLSSFEISCAATSSEEIGNRIYPPMRVLLEERGLDCSRHRARRVRRSDYDAYDLIVGMDKENRWDLSRLFHGDPDGKLRNLKEYAGLGDLDIADPWYTRDFSGCLEEMERACYGLFEALTGVVFLDFRHSADIPALYEELRSKMAWEPWYGESLDALHDILTGLPHRGSRFVLMLPGEDAPAEVRLYAERIRRVIEDSEERAAE